MTFMNLAQLAAAVLLAATTTGCHRNALSPVVAHECRLNTEQYAGQKFVVHYLISLTNTTGMTALATRVEFSTWLAVPKMGMAILDVRTPIAPETTIQVARATSLVQLSTAHDFPKINAPPTAASISCRVVAVRFKDGTIWTARRGLGSP